MDTLVPALPSGDEGAEGWARDPGLTIVVASEADGRSIVALLGSVVLG